MKKVVIVDNISKCYPSPLQVFTKTLFGSTKQTLTKPVLQFTSFSIYDSDVLGIIGKNGAGKSTLLKLISGTLKPSSGTISIEGRVASLLELGSGFNPNFTGRENVEVYAKVLGFSHRRIKAEMNEIIDFSGLAEYINEPLRTYSSGMAARLAFTVATKVEPDILIIDEALSVGDAEFKQKCFSKIKSLQDKGVTIIFCSHSLYQIEMLCNKVLWLDKGEVKFFGEPQEAITLYRDFISAKPLDKKNYSKQESEDKLAYIKKIIFYKNDTPHNEDEHFVSEKDDLRIEVNFSVQKASTQPSVSISFALIDGPIICGLGSFEESIISNIKNGKGSICLNLKKINLLKGTYSININLMNNDGTVCLDSVTRARTIKVRQNSLKQGYVLLNHEWTSHRGLS
jgi:lipopolysaccharide transport system ATP-binding protein